MPTIEEIKSKVLELCEEREPKGYLINPLLKELNSIVNEVYGGDSPASLFNQYYDYCFIAQAYEKIGRFALAANFYVKAIQGGYQYFIATQDAPEQIDKVYYRALLARNFYVDDDCLDIEEMVRGTGLIEESSRFKTYEMVMNRRRTLKHDPVEMTDKYLNVIDEVEEEIEQVRMNSGRGGCHELWLLKTEALAKRGIRWRSPAILNPRVRFD
ncbi:MAG: hypothetical protein K5925_00065 [Bacilli bacterium]|nr:hypothetical protein [Bacilli bacterium]